MRYIITMLLAAVVAACSNEAAGPAEQGAGSEPRTIELPGKGGAGAKRPPSSPEEQMRRSEAVRRAAEELAVRGIKTDGYLLNLIAEDDIYRVAFVKHSGAKLRAEITVRLRKADFEIVSIDAPPGAGRDGGAE